MDQTVPTVSPDAPLDAVLQAIESTGRRRVVVLSASGRVVGIITDGDLLRQIEPGLRPGLLARLRAALGGPRDSSAQALPDLVAADVMSQPVLTIGPETRSARRSTCCCTTMSSGCRLSTRTATCSVCWVERAFYAAS